MCSQHPYLLADALILGCCFLVEKKMRQNKMVVVVIVLHFDSTEPESVTPKYFLGQGKKRTQTLFLKEPLLGSLPNVQRQNNCCGSKL
jgi:hypothetical protein